MFRDRTAVAFKFGTRAFNTAKTVGTTLTTAINDNVRNADLGQSARSLWTLGGRNTTPPRLDEIHVILQPGWAVFGRSEAGYAPSRDHRNIVLSVHGICILDAGTRAASRTQRAVISLAKRFAALPTLPIGFSPPDSTHLKPVTESTGTDSFRNLEPMQPFSDPTSLYLAHKELDKRLQPFWTTVVPSQHVLIKVSLLSSVNSTRDTFVFQQYAVTDENGHFRERINIPAEAVSDAWPATVASPERLVSETPADPSRTPLFVKVTCKPVREADIPYGYNSSERRPSSSMQSEQHGAETESSMEKLATSVLRVSEPGGVRILSDIDDTIKHSDLLAGSREVFRNVFCRPTKDMVVKGMNVLYKDLAQVGAEGFHYVSNSPVQLLASMVEFLRINDFPPEFSLALKSYAGMSMISSLLDSPAARKRDTILELLDSFPDCSFVLFGDSAEQDLELYVSVATSRPDQVLAIYIRDITTRIIDSLSDSQTPTDKSYLTTEHDRMHHNRDRSKTDLTADDADQDELDTPFDVASIDLAQRKSWERMMEWKRRVTMARQQIGATPLTLFVKPEDIRQEALALVSSQVHR